LNEPTFFTLDDGFFKPKLRHAQYCLIILDVAQYESAAFIRKTLKHPHFNTKAKRMGNIYGFLTKGLLFGSSTQKKKSNSFGAKRHLSHSLYTPWC